jgi:hypothetical protein
MLTLSWSGLAHKRSPLPLTIAKNDILTVARGLGATKESQKVLSL